MHEKAKSVCFNYIQPQKVKYKFVQINMKQVLYASHLLGLFLNCSNATHPVLKYLIF